MIVKMEHTSWVNEYGHDEGYIWREITMCKSGHLWKGSAIETDYSCGNCDGGRCDSCVDEYEVYKLSEPKPHIDPDYGWCDYNYQDTLEHGYFTSEEDARAFYDNLTL